MKSFFVRKTIVGILAIIVVTALIVFTHITTNIARDQICDNGGDGYCLNDWFNGGINNPVKMYYGGKNNEDFETITVDPCRDNGTVNRTCPFTNQTLDNAAYGFPIVQVEYVPLGLCIGTIIGGANNGEGILTACGDPYGNGAGKGTIMIEAATSAGPNGLIDVYWTNATTAGSKYRFVCSSKSFEGPVYLNFSGTLTGACNWDGPAGYIHF